MSAWKPWCRRFGSALLVTGITTAASAFEISNQGKVPWLLSPSEEPSAALVLVDLASQELQAVFTRADQSASLCPGHSYRLEFLSQPKTLISQGFLLTEPTRDRQTTLRLRIVREAMPPWAYFATLQVRLPDQETWLQVESFERIAVK